MCCLLCVVCCFVCVACCLIVVVCCLRLVTCTGGFQPWRFEGASATRPCRADVVSRRTGCGSADVLGGVRHVCDDDGIRLELMS